MTRIFSSLVLFVFMVTSHAQEVSIIPRPVEIKMGKGIFVITNQTVIAYDDFTKLSASFLQSYLKNNYQLSLQLTMHNRENKKAILLMYGGSQEKKGFYKLKCDSRGVTIGGDEEGVFYGIQTLVQLLSIQNLKSKIPNRKLTIPQLTITDYPRFAYRGMHLDVCRHFFPVSFIKKYLDYLAYHKMNYFHWHLTEDQGWRIEIKKYPNLTKTGGWRNGTIIGRYPGKGNDETVYGGFYTQEEIKEVVKYAADRYITVIPEIELPGHSSAAIAAYPFLSCFPIEPTRIPANMISKKSVNEQANGRIKLVQETWGIFEDVFCAGKDSTFHFLQDVMDEVMSLFPSTYIHVGGDECPKANWKRCPNCQKRMKDEKLKDEHELQSYFITRMEKYLNSKGRTLIGWDEILEGGLAPKAVVMSWRGEAGGIEAAKQNHDVIMTPGGWCYFDHSQSQNEDSVTFGGYTPVEKVYSYEPIPAKLNEQEGKHVLGAQGNVWTEYMSNTRKVEYQVFPRMSALSEVLWSKKENKSWEDFEKRLMTQFKRYELWKANYSKAYFDLKATVVPSPDNNGIVWKLETRNKDARIFYMNELSPQLQYSKPILIKKSQTYTATLHSDKNEKLSSISQKFHFNKATGKKITLTTQASQNYPGDGPFTLVNGIINEKGLTRGREFLGFLGTDCEAIIDLGTKQTIQNIKVHILNQVPSWIWRPQFVEVFISDDGNNFKSMGRTDAVSTTSGKGIMELQFEKPILSRYIKILVKNWGEIPAGNPGASTKAWLFVDEIEVN